MTDTDDVKIGTVCYHTNDDYTEFAKYVVFNVNSGLAHCVSTDGAMFTVGTANLNTTIDKAYEYACKHLQQKIKDSKQRVARAKNFVKTYEKHLNNLERTYDEVCVGIGGKR